MDRITYKDKTYILVEKIEPDNCWGCAFLHDENIEYDVCVEVGRGEGICVPDESGEEFIPAKDPRNLIEDTPEAIAEYTIRRIEGNSDG